MEIYNEEINDLFAVGNQKLQIHESLEVEDHKKNVFLLELILYYLEKFSKGSFVKHAHRSFVLVVQRGIFVAGLSEEIVNDADEVFKLIESGEGWK